MKKLLLSALLLAAGLVPALAETFTYDFSTAIPDGWTSSTTPFGFETSGSARGAQYNGAGTTTLTLTGAEGVSSVTVTYSANLASNATLALAVGTADWGTQTTAKVNLQDLVYTADKASGNITLTITRTSKSVYIKQIVVEADKIEPTAVEPAEPVIPEGLDADYNYAAIETLYPNGDTGSNQAYTFTQNNVKVDVTTGGQSANYFGVNATKAITFTAAKPIKGIVISGYAKSGFTATVSDGTVDVNEYCADYETESYPILVVKGTTSNTVTITCGKQLRIFKAEVYFASEPTVAPGAGDEDMYSYDAEPTTVSTKDVTFASGKVYQDIYDDYGYITLYFYNADSDLTLDVRTPVVDGTLIAPGTYPVTFTGQEGEVDGSYGRCHFYDISEDAFYDYDYAALYCEYDEEYNITPWYIYDGTLTVEAVGEDGVKMTLEGTTYNYSTIKATYTKEPSTATAITTPTIKTAAPAARKLFSQGRIVIERQGRTYNVGGQRMK